MGLFSRKNSNLEKNIEEKELTEELVGGTSEVDEGTEDDSETTEKEHVETEDERKDRIGKYADQVTDYFVQIDPIQLNMLERNKITKEAFTELVYDYIRSNVTQDEKDVEDTFKTFASFLWSYDIIDELIDDDEISDIKIYDWDHIRVQRLGHRETAKLKFRNPDHFKKFVEHTAIKNKASISAQNALQNFTDKYSSKKAIMRFNITTPVVNSNEKYLLSIRKIPKHKYTTERLIELGFFTREMADYFEDRVKNGGGLLVAGKGGSGKTTLLNWALDKLPDDISGLCIQENEELFSDHPDIAFQHTIINRGEGKIEYNLGDLARNGLLMDIDYFIIGEIKGAEALYLLNAVYTGAKGWATVHGSSATEAMKKLVDYIKYNSDYSQEEALQMLVHLDTVVFMKDFGVREVQEITGYDPEIGDLTYKKIF